MSCCGGNYGCKMYPDLIQENSAASETFVVGVLPPEKGRLDELDEMAAGSENGGCKCGSNCTCDPCNCK